MPPTATMTSFVDGEGIEFPAPRSVSVNCFRNTLKRLFSILLVHSSFLLLRHNSMLKVRYEVSVRLFQRDIPVMSYDNRLKRLLLVHFPTDHGTS